MLETFECFMQIIFIKLIDRWLTTFSCQVCEFISMRNGNKIQDDHLNLLLTFLLTAFLLSMTK